MEGQLLCWTRLVSASLNGTFLKTGFTRCPTALRVFVLHPGITPLGLHPQMVQNNTCLSGNVPEWGQYPVGVFPGCNTKTLRTAWVLGADVLFGVHSKRLTWSSKAPRWLPRRIPWRSWGRTRPTHRRRVWFRAQKGGRCRGRGRGWGWLFLQGSSSKGWKLVVCSVRLGLGGGGGQGEGGGRGEGGERGREGREGKGGEGGGGSVDGFLGELTAGRTARSSWLALTRPWQTGRSRSTS